jgi:phosphoribosylaminoimidazole (AIR) synthetase
MRLLARGGAVADAEMLRTFNLGLGMLACVPKARAAEARRILEDAGERVFDVGEVIPSAHVGDAVDVPVEFTGQLDLAGARA